jgi:hypothetical protein
VSQQLRDLAYPLRSTTCLLAGLVFAAMIVLAQHAGLLGIWLLIIVVPGLFRYAIMIAEARAQATDVEPPGIEFFTLGGNTWTLFGILPFAVIVATYLALRPTSPVAAIGVAAAGVAILPAMLAVLVITHSPLQAINPVALTRLVRATGVAYGAAPLLMLALATLTGICLRTLPSLGILAAVYALFAFHASTGSLIRAADLLGEIDIPIDETVAIAKADADLDRERTLVLNHAYALFSRGNRAGALAHLEAWLREEPDIRTAQDWFLAHMLEWQDLLPAMCFAQQYLGWLLRHGETVPAVKLMLRLERLDERFRPADADRAAAIAAARATGNGELADLYSGGNM